MSRSKVIDIKRGRKTDSNIKDTEVEKKIKEAINRLGEIEEMVLQNTRRTMSAQSILKIDRIEAKEIVIKDSQNRDRINIGTSRDDPWIVLYDKEEQPLICIFISSDIDKTVAPFISFHSPEMDDSTLEISDCQSSGRKSSLSFTYLENGRKKKIDLFDLAIIK